MFIVASFLYGTE